MMKLIDIHSHLQFYQFDVDRSKVIAQTLEAGIGVINVGTDIETSRQAISLAETNSEMWATVGIHPTDLPPTDQMEEVFANLGTMARHRRVLAIGECGLESRDGEFDERREPEQKQLAVFKRQIDLAIELDKPLMIHCRNAYAKVLEIFDSYFPSTGKKLRGNIHFFAGDWSVARKFLALGFTLSFTGVITFPPKAGQADPREVIKQIPLEQIMVETDCPFVAPVPYRGKRNEPIYVKEIVRRIAEIRGVSFEIVAGASLANAKRLFAL